MTQSIIDVASRFLAQNDKICLICHTSPDGDTLGGAFGLFYALKSLGKSVYVESFDGFPEKFQYLYPDNILSEQVVRPSLCRPIFHKDRLDFVILRGTHYYKVLLC